MRSRDPRPPALLAGPATPETRPPPPPGPRAGGAARCPRPTGPRVRAGTRGPRGRVSASSALRVGRCGSANRPPAPPPSQHPDPEPKQQRRAREEATRAEGSVAPEADPQAASYRRLQPRSAAPPQGHLPCKTRRGSPARPATPGSPATPAEGGGGTRAGGGAAAQ